MGSILRATLIYSQLGKYCVLTLVLRHIDKLMVLRQGQSASVSLLFSPLDSNLLKAPDF